MGDSDAITAGGRTIVTWLTPYWDLWQSHVGAIAGGRLAKAITPPRKLLGDEACLSAFRAYCLANADKKSPEWFAKDCRHWQAVASAEPVVSVTGTLTHYGKRVYEGRA